MKSEYFSGFDEIKADDMLKGKVMRQINSDIREKPSSRIKTRLILSVASFAIIVVTAAAINFLIVQKRPMSSSNAIVSDYIAVPGVKIITAQPNTKSDSNKTSYSIAVMPSENSLYSYANTIVYGSVEGIRWVELENEQDLNLRYQTIISVKILNNYKGIEQKGKTIDVLLPFYISGTGSGTYVEENENACKLSKGTKSFFFLKKFDDADTIQNGSSTVKSKDICSYGTKWGNQYILPNENGMFHYIFTPSKELSFHEVERVIKNNLSE